MRLTMSVDLRSGGSISLAIDVDQATLTPDERALVDNLIAELHTYTVDGGGHPNFWGHETRPASRPEPRAPTGPLPAGLLCDDCQREWPGLERVDPEEDELPD